MSDSQVTSLTGLGQIAWAAAVALLLTVVAVLARRSIDQRRLAGWGSRLAGNRAAPDDPRLAAGVIHGCPPRSVWPKAGRPENRSQDHLERIRASALSGTIGEAAEVPLAGRTGPEPAGLRKDFTVQPYHGLACRDRMYMATRRCIWPPFGQSSGSWPLAGVGAATTRRRVAVPYGVSSWYARCVTCEVVCCVRTAPAGELVLLGRGCRSEWLTAARSTGHCGMSGHRAPGHLARRATPLTAGRERFTRGVDACPQHDAGPALPDGRAD